MIRSLVEVMLILVAVVVVCDVASKLRGVKIAIDEQASTDVIDGVALMLYPAIIKGDGASMGRGEAFIVHKYGRR